MTAEDCKDRYPTLSDEFHSAFMQTVRGMQPVKSPKMLKRSLRKFLTQSKTTRT